MRTSARAGAGVRRRARHLLAIQLRDGDENAKLDELAALEPLLQRRRAGQTEVGGLIPFLDDANRQISDDITKAEMLSLPILLVLLILIFRGWSPRRPRCWSACSRSSARSSRPG